MVFYVSRLGVSFFAILPMYQDDIIKFSKV